MRGFVTLEQEEFAYLWKIILVQQLILYVLLINIIHLLSKGAGRQPGRHPKSVSLMSLLFCSFRGRDNHSSSVMENQSQS